MTYERWSSSKAPSSYDCDRADAKYAFLFYKSGIIEVVKEWLEEPEDTRKTPKELADTLSMIMAIDLEIIT